MNRDRSTPVDTGSIEVPEEDRWEQRQSVFPLSDEPDLPMEADLADIVEQRFPAGGDRPPPDPGAHDELVSHADEADLLEQASVVLPDGTDEDDAP